MNTHTAVRASNRLLVRAVMVTAILAALLGILFGAWVIDDTFDTDYWFTAFVATPLALTPIVEGTIGQSTVQYHEVIIYSSEALVVPRTLIATSHALHFSLFVLACVSVIILSNRLLANRRFTRTARWSMLAIGVLASLTSVAAPMLHDLSGKLAATALGYPVSGGGDDSTLPLDEQEWIVPDAVTLFDTNWALLVLGVLLILAAATFLRGERLQNDTEGLI
jgi:hypothetical protein